MNQPSTLPAVIAYIPVFGWLYVFFLQRKNSLALYHLKQSLGLFLFLVAVFVGWAVIAWLIAWIPYMAVVGAALFAVVIIAFAFGVMTWVIGILNAWNSRSNPLPGFGRRAERLPIA